MKKVLITGSNGLLGANLAYIFKEEYEVYLLDRNAIKIDDCKNISADLTDFEKTNKIIEEIKPEAVIHCAALTNVDYCEEHPEEAELINYKVTENLAKITKKINAKIIYISTDSVFDGELGDYKEDASTNPKNVYAKTKLRGEEAIKINPNHLIARTNIYGWNMQNKLSLGEWMLDKFEKKEEFSGFKDIIFAPILVNNLGRALLEICKRDIRGVLHIVGSEKISKYDFAVELAKIFKLDSKLVKPEYSESAKLKAERPKNSYLNSEKARKILETKLLNVKEGLEEFKNLRDIKFVQRLKANMLRDF